jgi:hypothetical protein
MNQNVPKSGQRKGSETKRSKQKIQDKVAQDEALGVHDFLRALAEVSIPTDHETDVMLSEAILKMAEPHIDKYDKKDEHVKTIIGLAVASWNLMLIPKKYYTTGARNIIEHIPADFTLDQTEVLLSMVFDMITTKLKYYSNIIEYINRCEILLTEEGWSLRVLSTATIPEQADTQ